MDDHQWRNTRVRDRETARINALAQWGYTVEWVTRYQARINGALDLFPTGMKWHSLRNNQRGGYAKDDLASICATILRR